MIAMFVISSWLSQIDNKASINTEHKQFKNALTMSARTPGEYRLAQFNPLVILASNDDHNIVPISDHNVAFAHKHKLIEGARDYLYTTEM